MGEHVQAGDLDIWTEQVGEGPDVLLIGGLGDTVESWQFQLDGLADRYRLTAFDNRGAGRTALPSGPATAAVMADDAAAPARARRLLRARRRFFTRQRNRAGARPAAPGAGSQSRAHEHVCPSGRVVPLTAQLVALAAGGRAERTRLLRGVLHLGLHA